MTLDDENHRDERQAGPAYQIGYRRPPLHSRFQPGVSGNPAGRRKGTPNLKTILEQVLREQIALREGKVTKKITKAEAIIRGLVIGAMKSDSRSQMTLFRLAEQVGQFDQTPEPFRIIELVIVDPRPARRDLIENDGDER